MLADSENLRTVVQSIDEQLQPVSEIRNLDEAKLAQEEAVNLANQLKAELRKIEDAQPRGLDQESLSQLKASEELAKSELEKLGKVFLNF